MTLEELERIPNSMRDEAWQQLHDIASGKAQAEMDGGDGFDDSDGLPDDGDGYDEADAELNDPAEAGRQRKREEQDSEEERNAEVVAQNNNFLRERLEQQKRELDELKQQQEGWEADRKKLDELQQQSQALELGFDEETRNAFINNLGEDAAQLLERQYVATAQLQRKEIERLREELGQGEAGRERAAKADFVKQLPADLYRQLHDEHSPLMKWAAQTRDGRRMVASEIQDALQTGGEDDVQYLKDKFEQFRNTRNRGASRHRSSGQTNAPRNGKARLLNEKELNEQLKKKSPQQAKKLLEQQQRLAAQMNRGD